MALFNYAYAKKNNGKFILRLEDTDVDRNVTGAEDAIYAGLSWLGLSWDEGPDIGGSYAPYKQSEKLEVYKKKADTLVEKGLAYQKDGAIYLKTPNKDISWNDLVRGKIEFAADQTKDFVIIKSDGYPVYHFAVVVDDIDMKISHVIRGEEHISNTPRQLAIYGALEEKPPEFAHLPTLRNSEHKKLSKRRDPVDLRLYREQGYLPEALVNFLCLLGWSHPEGKEIFSLKEFIQKFDLKRVRLGGPVFDAQKLNWLNGVYIRNKSDEELLHLSKKYISFAVSDSLLLEIIPLIRERIEKLSDIEPLIQFFWKQPEMGKSLFDDPDSILYISSAITTLGGIKDWTLENINSQLGKEIHEKGFKTGKFYMALRIALTGGKVTPPINESMVILGQEETMQRLKEAEKALLA